MTALIQWPEHARRDATITKERLYAEAKLTSAVRQRFIDDLREVRWAYKLGEESLRLKPGSDVTEIQIFVIDLKGSNLDNSVLATIDKAIPSQIIFELHRADGLWTEQAMAAAYKRTGGKAPRTADYYRTGWVSADEPRVALPTALDMDGLYTQLLARLLPHPMRPAEQLSDALDRMDHIRGLGREISGLERRVRTKPQFNRKVELRNEARAKQAELDELMKDDNRMTEDASWRS